MTTSQESELSEIVLKVNESLREFEKKHGLQLQINFDIFKDFSRVLINSSLTNFNIPFTNEVE